jgi:hypothetical protein
MRLEGDLGREFSSKKSGRALAEFPDHRARCDARLRRPVSWANHEPAGRVGGVLPRAFLPPPSSTSNFTQNFYSFKARGVGCLCAGRRVRVTCVTATRTQRLRGPVLTVSPLSHRILESAVPPAVRVDKARPQFSTVTSLPAARITPGEKMPV